MSLKRDVHCQELGVKKTGVGEVRRSMKLSPATLGWLLVFLIAGMNPVLLGAQSNASPFVEIGFNSAPASAFYSELTVRESSEGTAYAACGFSHGWLGVQELVGGKKAVVFSVSSMPKSKKHAAAAVRDTQVRVANLGEGVRERVSLIKVQWNCLMIWIGQLENHFVLLSTPKQKIQKLATPLTVI